MMGRVNVLSIDRDYIIKLNDVGEYGFFVNISINPSQEWKACFKSKWEEQHNNLLMPEVIANSAKIQIRFNLGESLQTYISELLNVIVKCNDIIWQYDVEKARRIAEMRERESDKQLNIEAIKKELLTVTLN